MNQIAVVISNHNYAQYVASCIESVLSQRMSCDVFVVDDCSTDTSWYEISKFRGKLTAIRLKENSGGNARGKNVGISFCSNPYIATFDSDDMMTPNSLSYRFQAIREKGVLYSFGFLHRVTEEVQYKDFIVDLALLEHQKIHPKMILKAENVARRNFDPGDAVSLIGGTAVLASRKLYERYGLFDEDLKWKIDKEMWYRWLVRGIRPAYIRRNIAIYRRHKQSATMMAGAGDFTKRDPFDEVNKRYARATESRKSAITSENTLLLSEYDATQYIAEVLT